MRLLNTESKQMRVFSDGNVPCYAILSHTWGEVEDEVTLQMWESGQIDSTLDGYQKIIRCCDVARRNEYEWVWIDTCCIDRKSMTDLSESINSMYAWYKNADMCYVYLSDVLSDNNTFESENHLSIQCTRNLRKSRWFTRGWTLQELIAPRRSEFFSRNWDLLGTKSQLSATLYDITRIDREYLNGKSLEHASIAKRMSWASKREASRTEDIAYCLLGIFDVHMSLIYGEKEKAFQRLQKKIVERYPHDPTIFAWGIRTDRFSMALEKGSPSIKEMRNTNPDQALLGLLASSPSAFATSDKLVPYHDVRLFYRSSGRRFDPTEIAGKSVTVDFFNYRNGSCVVNRPLSGLMIPQLHPVIYAALFCGTYITDETGQSFAPVVIPLIRADDNGVTRSNEMIHSTAFQLSWKLPDMLAGKETFVAEPKPPIDVKPGDILLQRIFNDHGGEALVNIHDGGVRPRLADGLIQGENPRLPYKVVIVYQVDGKACFGLVLYRKRLPWSPRDPLSIGIIPLNSESSDDLDSDAIMVSNPEFGRDLAAPNDVWTLDTEPFPRITVKSRRILLDQDPERPVDVLDVAVEREEVIGQNSQSWRSRVIIMFRSAIPTFLSAPLRTFGQFMRSYISWGNKIFNPDQPRIRLT